MSGNLHKNRRIESTRSSFTLKRVLSAVGIFARVVWVRKRVFFTLLYVAKQMAQKVKDNDMPRDSLSY